MLAGVLAAHRRCGARRISEPDEGRYLYVGALLVVLLAVELARGVVVPRWASRLAGVRRLALAVVANVGDLRDAARDLRAQSALARARARRARAGAHASVEPGSTSSSLPGYPFLVGAGGRVLRGGARRSARRRPPARELAAAPSRPARPPTRSCAHPRARASRRGGPRPACRLGPPSPA